VLSIITGNADFLIRVNRVIRVIRVKKFNLYYIHAHYFSFITVFIINTVNNK
jgi:hypothetical protein